MVCTIISGGSELSSSCQNEHEPPYSEIKKQLRKIIGELLFEGYDTFYVNCEYGIPLWAAEIICALKLYNNIILNIVMPYEEQSVNWSEEHRDRYFNVHQTADSVIMASSRYYSDVYELADEMMINESDLLVVFGKSDNELHAVNYARKKGIAVKYFYSDPIN